MILGSEIPLASGPHLGPPSHNAPINNGKEFIFTHIRAHLMGHLPYTRLPDFDYRNPVSFWNQVQVNGFIVFIAERAIQVTPWPTTFLLRRPGDPQTMQTSRG
jgi:hypothetical protein